jgi:hypothetical protein
MGDRLLEPDHPSRMDRSPEADRSSVTGGSLETWTAATFDVVALGLVGVLAAHESGVLDEALSDVGTVPGVLVFGSLWVLVLLAMRWVLADGGLARANGRSLGSLLARGVAGGSLAGTAFAGGLGLLFGLFALTSGAGVLTVALSTIFGAVGGALGGALLGLVFGLLDVGLARGADAVVDRLVDR